MSFRADENFLTAIVGPSGSGKSTIGKLLVHYWDVKTGQITIGGRNITQYTASTLMDMISYVSQDNFLFDDTILDNIRLGKLGATGEEVIQAAKAAACHDFIMKLPNQYQTRVGVDGGKLSGGEKQRITIARAILKNAPVIVLDEATAYADAENEDLIQDAIHQLINEKTIIVIAHRLQSIINADQILVVVSSDMKFIEEQGMNQLAKITTSIVSLLVTIVMLAFFSLPVAVIMVLTCLLVGSVFMVIQKIAKKHSFQVQDRQKAATSAVIEYIKGMQVIKAFHLVGDQQKRTNAAYQNLSEAQYTYERNFIGPLVMAEVLIALSIGVLSVLHRSV